MIGDGRSEQRFLFELDLMAEFWPIVDSHVLVELSQGYQRSRLRNKVKSLLHIS